jgi:hypothetical protein
MTRAFQESAASFGGSGKVYDEQQEHRVAKFSPTIGRCRTHRGECRE